MATAFDDIIEPLPAAADTTFDDLIEPLPKSGPDAFADLIDPLPPEATASAPAAPVQAPVETTARSAGLGLVQGLTNVQAGIGEARQSISDIARQYVGNVPANIFDALTVVPRKLGPLAKQAGEAAQAFFNPDAQANPTAAAIGSGLGQAPVMIAAGLANPAAPLIMGGFSGFGSGAETARDIGVTNPLAVAGMGLGFGGIEAGIERFGGIGAKQALGGALTRMAKGIGSEAIEEPLTGAAQGLLTAAAAAPQLDPDRPGFTRSGKDLTDLDPRSPEYWQNRRLEAIGGAVGGTVFAPFTALANRPAPAPQDSTTPSLPTPPPDLPESLGELTAEDVADLEAPPVPSVPSDLSDLIDPLPASVTPGPQPSAESLPAPSELVAGSTPAAGAIIPSLPSSTTPSLPAAAPAATASTTPTAPAQEKPTPPAAATAQAPSAPRALPSIPGVVPSWRLPSSQSAGTPAVSRADSPSPGEAAQPPSMRESAGQARLGDEAGQPPSMTAEGSARPSAVPSPEPTEIISRKGFARRSVRIPARTDGVPRDMVDLVREMGGINRPPRAKKDRMGRSTNQFGEHDALRRFRKEMPAYYAALTREGGRDIDKMADDAATGDSPLLPASDIDAFIETLMRDIEARRTQAREAGEREKELAKQEREALRTGERQDAAWNKATQKETGKIGVTPFDLTVGDTLEVDGEPLTVLEITYDEDGNLLGALLEDGDKFGRQWMSAGELAYVDEANLAQYAPPPPAAAPAPSDPFDQLLTGTESTRPRNVGETTRAQVDDVLAELMTATRAGEADRAQGRLGFKNLDTSGTTAGFLNRDIVNEALTLLRDGITTFTDWSRAMVKRFGEAIRDYLQGVWQAAMKTSNQGFLAGPRAFMSDQRRRSLDTAKAMAAAGKSSAEIRALTGWFPGKYDGKMRWEGSDRDASLDIMPFLQSTTGMKQAKLGEVLTHPVLFEAYPDAVNIIVDAEISKGGSFWQGSDGTPRISVEWDVVDADRAKLAFERNPTEANRLRMEEGKPEARKSMLDTLLHEIQHWIQQQEGFAKGGNLNTTDRAQVDAEIVAQAITEAQATQKQPLYQDESLEWILQYSDLTPSQKAWAINVVKAGDQAIKELQLNTPFGRYRRTAGEIEARDVQARQAMTDEERAAIEPYSSENIAPEDAIVMFHTTGPQMSMAAVPQMRETQSRFASPDEATRLYEVQSNERMLAEASAWLDANTVADALAAMESNTPPAGLRVDHLPALGERLLQRLTAATGQGTELERLQAEALLDRAGRAWQGQMSQEASRTLQQRAAANARLVPIAPVLAAKQVLVDRAEAVMTRRFEGGSEGVTRKLQDLNDRVSKSLPRMLNALRLKMYPGMTWADIFTDLPSAQKERQREIYRRLMLDQRLQNLTPDQRLKLTNDLDKAWQRERRKVFQAELKKAGVMGEKSAGDRARVEKALPKLMRMINLGMFNSELWREAVAPEYGLRTLTAEQSRNLRKQAEEAWKQPEGVLRNQKMAELLTGIQRATGASRIELLNSYWTASVLSGLRTQFDTWAAVINGFGTNLLQASTLLARGRGRAAVEAHAQWWRGLYEGVRESGQILARGDTSYLKRFGADVKRALEGESGASPVPLGELLWKNGNTFQKYGLAPVMMFTGRLMAAADHVNNTATTQGAMAVARALHPEIYGGRVAFTQSERTAARQQALREITGGTEPKRLSVESAQVSARTREILNGTINETQGMDASEIGDMAAFQNDPTGAFGAIYSAMKSGLGTAQRKLGAVAEDAEANKAARAMTALLAGSIHALTGTRFMRFGFNFGAELTRYMPGTYALGKAGFYGRDVSRMQQELLLGKNVVGLMIASTLAALFVGPDDEPEDEGAVQIEGTWADLTPEQQQQRRAAGLEPMTMWRRKDGKVQRVSYKQWPTMSLFAIVGGMKDEQRHKPATFEQRGVTGHLLRAAQTGLFQIQNVSAMRGLADLFGSPGFASDPMTEWADRFAKMGANYAGGMIPTVIKDTEIWTDPRNFKAEGAWEGIVRSMPILRKSVNDGRPQLNMLGEEVKLERSPWSRTYTSVQSAEAHRVLGSLLARGLSLPLPSSDVSVFQNGVKVPLETLGRDKVWQYERAVGSGYKEWLADEGADLLKMPVATADKIIKRRASQIKRMALANVRG